MFECVCVCVTTFCFPLDPNEPRTTNIHRHSGWHSVTLMWNAKMQCLHAAISYRNVVTTTDPKKCASKHTRKEKTFQMKRKKKLNWMSFVCLVVFACFLIRNWIQWSEWKIVDTQKNKTNINTKCFYFIVQIYRSPLPSHTSAYPHTCTGHGEKKERFSVVCQFLPSSIDRTRWTHFFNDNRERERDDRRNKRTKMKLFYGEWDVKWSIVGLIKIICVFYFPCHRCPYCWLFFLAYQPHTA